MTGASFEQATLKNTDFRKSKLTHTFWFKAKKLELACLEKTYLSNIRVRNLVVGEGKNQNFDLQDLRGVNLKGFDLSGSSFIHSDLTGANLENTNLSKSKLVHTQLDQTNLTRSTLTGAVIENWNITTNTKLDFIKCDYVFMRLLPYQRPKWLQLLQEDSLNDNENRHRKPNWGCNFEPGEFKDFITPIVQTLDLYHNQVVDFRLAAIAYNKLKQDNPDAQLELVSVEKKGENKNKLLLRSETTLQADHEALSNDYFANIAYLKSLPLDTLQALLVERGFTIQLITGLLGTGQQNSVSIHSQPTNTNVTENHNKIDNDKGNTYNQTGSFATGVNNGTINTQNIAGNINKCQE